MKYEAMKCRGLYLPTDPTARRVDILDVLIAKGSWDGIEDTDDERIFHYMDGEELNVGDVISDGFVVVEIRDYPKLLKHECGGCGEKYWYVQVQSCACFKCGMS